MEAVCLLTEHRLEVRPLRMTYGGAIEEAVSILETAVREQGCGAAGSRRLSSRWLSLKLLEGDAGLLKSLKDYAGYDFAGNDTAARKLAEARGLLDRAGISYEHFRDQVVSEIVRTCESIGRDTVSFEKKDYAARDRKIDRILTSKSTGIPIMLLLLFGVFWLTITGANYPSGLLADGLFWLEGRLHAFFAWLSAPGWLSGLLVDGMYRTLSWVVSVMLPPMAIFFPLFTLLEDLGYLPRIAFNLDNFFRKACAHGKQALTMCMGFGCNAAGIVGCRIIDSPRERLIAMLTNNFVPCNGRFPTLIAVITMFFAGTAGGMFGSVVSTLLLTAVIVLAS
jgi:ferrous iron transport protein B